LPPPTRDGRRIAATFEDKDISGAKGRRHDNGFDRLHRAVLRRKIGAGKWKTLPAKMENRMVLNR
jgi:hypothetical protein